LSVLKTIFPFNETWIEPEALLIEKYEKHLLNEIKKDKDKDKEKKKKEKKKEKRKKKEKKEKEY